MKKTVYLYLFVFTFLIALFMYFNYQNLVEEQASEIKTLKNKIEKLETKLNQE
ncbi:MAG: hypothetical protein L0J45_02885 [Psychroflexus sp.]|nr:hypothetical protein [Psychroflexus sp.]MDN6309543.1 hypothetical protein [Psychroflexus sp.]